MNKNISIVFMGTPDFAVPSLRALCNAGFRIEGVVTQPDRPKGRGQKLAASPVKEEALQHNLQVYQPAKIKEESFIEELSRIKPDFIVVVAFGQILPKSILNMPQIGCINVHASLLPAYRGAAPIHWAVINGEKETGVTTMLMDEGLDTGDILLKEKVSIPAEMTSGQLHDLLALKGADLLLKTLEGMKRGVIKPYKQDHSAASYAPLLKRADELIDWANPATKVYNQIRGLEPWPGAYTMLGDKPLKIRGAKIWAHDEKAVNADNGVKPGCVTEIVKGQGFVVKTGQQSLLVTKVQPFGKSTMPTDSFINGYNLKRGYIFNDR